MIRKLIESIIGNGLDRALAKASKRDTHRYLVYWNRGLGDIALGVYPLLARIREMAPDAEITVVTRHELAEAFQLLPVQRILVDDALVRGEPDGAMKAFARLGIRRKDFDVVLDRVNLTKWLAGQPRKVPPRLVWRPEFDALCGRFLELDQRKRYVGAHVNSETGRFYGYVKDWPADHWQALFAQIEARYPVELILFGHDPSRAFQARNIVDLRGKTSSLEMLSIIKNNCHVLIAPDSGVLTMAYYLDCRFPLTLISLWADPRQGILKKGTPSPNDALRHVPLRGADEQVANIGVAEVLAAVESGLADAKLRGASSASGS